MRKVLIPLSPESFNRGETFHINADKTVYYKCLKGCMYMRLGRAGRWDYIGEVFQDIYFFMILGQRFEIKLEFLL